jgi:hypothetical protein
MVFKPFKYLRLRMTDGLASLRNMLKGFVMNLVKAVSGFGVLIEHQLHSNLIARSKQKRNNESKLPMLLWLYMVWLNKLRCTFL